VEEKFADIFDEIFGIHFDQWTPPGKDIYESIEVSLEEAYHGLTRKLSVWREYLCPDCRGKGSMSGPSRTCSYCFGRGNIQVTEHGVSFDKQCPKCRGLGRIPKDPCRRCKARGVIPKKETVVITIPSRVKNGQQIRYPAQGSLAARGSHPGDLIAQICILPHEFFTFDGAHVLCEVPVNFLKAREGGIIEIPTLEGIKTWMLPAGVSSGEVLNLPGLGLGGDQKVRIRVFETKNALLPAQSLWSKIKRILLG
jgi:molecular chaperone DnaJ